MHPGGCGKRAGLEVEVYGLDVAGGDGFLSFGVGAGEGDTETTPVAQLHALAAEQMADEDFAELADGHHRFGGVKGGFIGKVHGHLGFVHLRGGHLGDVPFLGCILVVGIGALHGFLLKLP